MLDKIKRIKWDRNKITALLFVLFIVIITIGTGVKVCKSVAVSILRRVSVEESQTIPVENKVDNIVTSELSEEQTNLNSKPGVLKRTFNLINRTISLVEVKYKENAFLKLEFVNLNGAFQLLMNKKIIEDVDQSTTVYKMENGQLTFLYPQYETKYCVENMVELNEYLKQKNIDMLYIQAPYKVDKDDPKIPKELFDNVNKNADNFLEGIAAEKVQYMDLREIIKEEDLEYQDFFYDTDHHWKTEAAFWACGNVVEFLKQKKDKDYDNIMMDLDLFISTKYEKSFLGSQGKRVGRYYGGVDNYTLIYPKFETDYKVRILGHNSLTQEKTGSFRETIIDERFLDETESVVTNRYAAYFGGDYPLIEITNNDISNGKVLILQDSFGLPFSAFMSLNFNQIDIMDLRHFRGQTLFDYIDENSYDNVVFLYNPSVFHSETNGIQFNFK